MAALGHTCLLLALAVCAYGIGASLYGARRARPELCESGRRSVYALAGILTVAFAVLEVAFLRNDFTFNTVADTSSRTTPALYRSAAVWSSQEGSLLLWAWLLSLWSSLALFLVRRRMREVAAYATAVLLGLAGFFVALMLLYASPFATTHPAPAEGAGLDPLLRFPTMVIHPPVLYSGYTLCTIPLAFGIGALLARRVDADWTRTVRRFAFAAWLLLGTGILLGARWSYSVLGWGGYWGWDAVENASLMPWLTGTALLHSLMIQEKRGMLKVWNMSLVLATGTLAIMGTFLVRSGSGANARRNFTAPVLLALATLAALLALGVQRKPLALAMFGCAAFVLGSIAQEFFRGTRARRAIARERVPIALLALVRRNRRRYGGYVVHVGMAVLFVGVAASSSFQHATELGLSPGQSSRVGGHTVRYVRPTATITPRQDAAHTGPTLSLGPVPSALRRAESVPSRALPSGELAQA